MRTDARLERLLLDVRVQDLAVDGYELLGGEIALSLRNVDVDALSGLTGKAALNLSLAGPDDITGRIEIAFAGEQPLLLAHPESVAHALRAAAADAFYEEALAGLELLPFFSVGEDHVTASLAISEGRLLADGIEFMDIAAILVVVLAQAHLMR